MFRFWQRKKRVLVLGLDCASPDLVFHQWAHELPTLNALQRQGTWGVLRSAIPCITVPAWASMLSSRDPGVIGVYGFRNRADYTYEALTTADSRAVKVPRVWDTLGAANKTSLVMNVPQTYPVTPIKGYLASCFLTPGTGSAFTYPAIFKQEILKQAPNYPFDIPNFRTPDKADLQQRIHDFVDVQYSVVESALTSKEWDFGIHVNMGIDRVHHGFWRYHDPQHRLHEPNSPYQHTIRDVYKQVDSWLGRLMEKIDDDVTVMIVSDHGIKRMDGAIAINEWLWREGWLVLKTPPTGDGPVKFESLEVDWSKTRAWSTGGYYGRIFLNVQGREPQGVIPAADYERVRDELAAQIACIPDPLGQPLTHRIFKPQEIYQQISTPAPDLIVYFGDLNWRCVGTVGYGQPYTLENDTGPDDANHAEEGMFLLYEPGRSGGQSADRQLMDVAPTILQQMGVTIPGAMQGQAIAFK